MSKATSRSRGATAAVPASSFKVGDCVQWRSQANASPKVKVGIVVSVVPSGKRPDRVLFLDLYKGPGCGFGRNEVSYVVRVKNKHYWPRVSHLAHADS
jgi:hypothetical protein